MRPMLLVNRLLDSVFDLLMRPLERVGVVTGLAVVSLFTAIAILVVVRITSDQRAMAAVNGRSTPICSRSGCSTTISGRFCGRNSRSYATTRRISACRSCRCCGCSFRPRW